MNLLLNPGFDWDPPLSQWAVSPAGAELASGRTSNGVQLIGSRQITAIGPPPVIQIISGSVTQSLPLTAGTNYIASVWVRCDVAWAPIAMSVGGVEIGRIDATPVGEWVLFSVPFTPDQTGDAAFVVAAQIYGAETGISFWTIDDCSLEIAEEQMGRGAYRAYKAVFDAYLGIAGQASGYYTDLGGRVYPRILKPDQMGQAALPYACLALFTEDAPAAIFERHMRDRIRIQCVIFVAGNERSMDPETSTVRAVADAFEDQRQMFLRWTPTEAVQSLTPYRHQLYAGVPDGIDWGEAWMTFDAEYFCSADDLGPNAP